MAQAAEKTANTISDLIAAGADAATALSAPGGTPLSFRDLRALVAGTVCELNANGIGRGDRVAIVLPNGPEMAAAFIAVAAGATSAPLNPNYKAEEFEFYLKDLGAKLLVAAEGVDSPAVTVAEKLGVTVARLKPLPEDGAGAFRLLFPEGDAKQQAQKPGAAEPDDVALVLHTSGTTSRPKIVPLKQSNIAASARNIRESLAFTAEDCGLNIMPLFHIHGLVAGILAPLSAGGRVCCTTGHSSKFFAWMKEAEPTWYTGVPTMHQDILSHSKHHEDVVAGNKLRFIRSCSSSLPPQVMKEVEAKWNAPVLEAYGMTEAAHQMASNPLPPGARHAGSVGVATGPEIGIISEDGEFLQPGEIGEIVIRGDNVMSGYENNDKANAEAFTKDGWFRTGDQGTLTAEGYLSLTGRIKEIIIRGGEKISPREVDEILMDHPAVRQVVTFAVKHERLGEDVAAAIVLKDGETADEDAIRAFAGEHLSKFKVPAKIVFVDEIPKGATGKLQRIGLAEKLGLG